MSNRSAWTVICLLPIVWLTSPVRADAQSVTLAETAPVETTLDDPSVPEAWEVWRAMIQSARTHLEIASFYFSNAPESRLEAVLAEVLDAGARGVQVRVLADAGFFKTYPETLRRLAAAPGVDVRLIDYRTLTGGVMHAKYFIVDGREAFVGSQNWDWRALQHIHELGLRIQLPAYAQELRAVFIADWVIADTLGTPEFGPFPEMPTHEDPSEGDFMWTTPDSQRAVLKPAMSPRGQLPDSSYWDLPQILELLDAARDSIQITLLSYTVHSRSGGTWHTLDDALRSAAARGVVVRLMVADWSKSKPKIDDLKSLQQVENITVRLVSIPEASSGFIPFARVLHTKYLTVDGRWCWLGTSNWEESYFTTSRNVGLVAQSAWLTDQLDRDFTRWWNSALAETVDPAVEYVPPRVSD